MKAEGITVCVGEKALKFLKLTLPQNVKFFDTYTVLTTPEDTETTNFCIENKVRIIQTNGFYANNSKFNKGIPYNIAFQLLEHKHFVSILDCDSYIPDDLGKVILERNFDPEYLYGSRRIIIPTLSDFNKIINGEKELLKDFWCPYGIGYGYFILFNVNCSTVEKYGLNYPSSYDLSNSDWQFRNLWGETINGDKEYTRLLREIPNNIWHLGQPNIAESDNFFR